jgi:hypothetical protein
MVPFDVPPRSPGSGFPRLGVGKVCLLSALVEFCKFTAIEALIHGSLIRVCSDRRLGLRGRDVADFRKELLRLPETPRRIGIISIG